MHTSHLPFKCVAAACFVFIAGTAHAGRGCEEKPPTAATLTQALTLAEKTRESLESSYRQSGTQVALLARMGQDLSKYGVTYSHAGWAYRQPNGIWRVVHKLNNCGTADGFIYRQGLGDFFLDDLYRYQAGITVPTPAVQRALLPYLTSGKVLTMQSQPYSMLSYAWGQKYQQSNQWGLESLAAALAPSGAYNRTQAQTWLKSQGYVPTTLKLGPLTRLGGRATRANIAFDDHPSEKRFSDRIETITVDSVTNFMQRAQLTQSTQQLALP